MNTIELLFDISNIIFFFGTARLFVTVYKNKACLKDYDFYGSSSTMFGMFIAMLAQFELKYWTVIMFQIPTYLFWLYVSIYSYKNRRW